MDDNKFFNASKTTSAGSAKFMPPQKRAQLESGQAPEENKFSDAPTGRTFYNANRQQQQQQSQPQSQSQSQQQYQDRRTFGNQQSNYNNNYSNNQNFTPSYHQNPHLAHHSHSHHHQSHSVEPNQAHHGQPFNRDEGQGNKRFPNSLFGRNRSNCLSEWGHRHLRTGHIDKEVEAEEKALFETPKGSNSLVENATSYDHLKVEVNNKFNLPVPPVQEDFKSLGLSQCLLDNIDRCGYTKLTIIQRNAIPSLSNGLNLMASSQTGSGKTAAFLIPIIQNLLNSGPPKGDVSKEEYKKTRKCYPLALILAPTRELAIQIHEEARKFCHLTGILAKVIYGGKEAYNQQRYLSWDGCDILVTTPGRLIDFMDRIVDFSFIRYIVLDEADRMLDMGFEPQIRAIMDTAYERNAGGENILIAMFSATFPKEVKSLAEKYLQKYLYIGIGAEGGKTGSVSKTIKQELIDARHKMKNQILFDSIKGLDGKMLIFCGTKKAVSNVYNYLSAKNLFVSQIHGDLSQKDRESELGLFKNKCSILIATDVASRGLDIPDVAFVINYDLPTNIESYIHRIGRTGRIGKTGTAISFVTDFDEPMYNKLYNVLKDSNQEIPAWFKEIVGSKYQREERYAPQGRTGGKPFHHKWRGGGGGGYGGNRGYGGGRPGGGFQNNNNDEDMGYDSDYSRPHTTGGFNKPYGGAGGGNYYTGNNDFGYE